MLRLLLLVSLLVFASARGSAQQPARRLLSPDLAPFLAFEHDPRGKIPSGWFGTPPDTVSVDDTIVHGGKLAVRIERTAASAGAISNLSTSLPIDFSGQRIELRGFLRTEDVTGYVGLWLRQDGDQPDLALENMHKQQLKGTTDWREYTITLPLHRDARRLVFGALVNGTGKAWVDDLQLLVDGQPIWQAPKAARELTVLDQDHEFDAGSKIALRAATPLQIENLATLGRVWGFLKYHHPKVTSGQAHWDYELFRVMPAVLSAADRAAANELLADWIERLGELKPGPISALPVDLHLNPELAWLDDRAALGARLAERLRAVHAARPGSKTQFYLTLAPNVGNPLFEREPSYTQVKSPDAGYQLLALFRFWNIIRYWSPYRNLLDDNWDAVLAEFIPRLGHAATTGDYQRELLALVARVHDTHTNLPTGFRERPPTGDHQLPAVLRFIEGRATVVRPLPRSDDPAPALQRGDVIHALNGTPVEELVKTWSPFYAASNEPARRRDIARNLGRGPAGPARLRVERGDTTLDLEVPRVPLAAAVDPNGGRHDLPGPAFRLLSKEVAYLKLSAVKLEDVKSYVGQAAGTQGWIIDIRNYPSAFVVFALGQHFVAQPTEFVRFTMADPANPGAFAFSKTLALQPQSPRYTGKIVILVDEVSLSQSEYTAMAFRSAPGALVVGSTTAGADGNVSRIPLPGGQQTALSGIGIFYPDKRPTQRIGILPDIEARPTLAGIRAGRDEVLEVALRQILGPTKSDEELRALIPAPE